MFFSKLIEKYFSVEAKFLTDRERVKQNQKSQKEIKDSLRNKWDLDTSEDEPKAKKLEVVKNPDGTLQFPSKISGPEVVEELKQDRVKIPPGIEKFLEQDWIERKAFVGMLDRFPESSTFRKALLRAAQPDGDEPYKQGDSHNLVWRQYKSKVWNDPQAMPTHVKDLKGTLGKDVPIGGPDPFQWLDARYGVSKRLLRKNEGKKLQINTRSDLIAHEDYIEVLDPQNHTVNMHVLTLDKEIGRRLEPGAPSIKRRFNAIKRLKEAGIRVNVVIDKLESPDLSFEIKKRLQLKKQDISSMLPPSVKVLENKVILNSKTLKKLLESIKDLVEVRKNA